MRMRLYNIIYIINMPMTPLSQMIRFIYFFQIILNNISFVKVKIVKPKHQKWNPKQNAQTFCGTCIVYIIILTYVPKRGSPKHAFTFPLNLDLEQQMVIEN
jgi:hypothetical protein